MAYRPQKEKVIISAGAELIELQTTLKLLKRDRDNKKYELGELEKRIKQIAALIVKKGGKASIN